MKNKRWKREAKRLKGQAAEPLWCGDCEADPFKCHNACCVGIRHLERLCKGSK